MLTQWFVLQFYVKYLLFSSFGSFLTVDVLIPNMNLNVKEPLRM